jgi:hypothetical protein
MSKDQAVPNTSAGKLHLLDLAAMKSQMGDRWTRMADAMENFFEGAVRRNLGPGDTFVRKSELTYILLFRNLTAEEAQLKCRTISEEVCERLFGDQIHRASLRNLVLPLSADTLVGNTISDALDELLERKGKEIIVQITSKAQPEPEIRKETAPEVPDDKALTFLYRPIWDATKNVVITYLCQSVDENYAETIGSGRGSSRSEDRQAAIDKDVLQECAIRTHQLHRSGLRILSGVTVALDTLSHSRLWASYSKELQSIAPAVSKDFAFFVTGIDSGVPNIRLAQELPKLTRLSHQIFCVIEDRGYVGTRFSRTGTHAIGISLAPGEAEASSMGRVVELAQQAADASLAAFVLDIPSTSLMLHALGQGIRYLEGPVIRQAVSDPRHAFMQSLEYVYTSAKKKAPPHKQGLSPA